MTGRAGFAAATAATAAVLGAATGAELFHRRASRAVCRSGPREAPEIGGFGEGAADPGSEIIVVLGYPATRSGGLHPLQRWRTEIAVRSRDPQVASRLVFSGAGRPGGPSEAEVMAAYARDVLGVPAECIRLETKARSTRENVQFTLPLLQSATTIKIASDPMHAARARRYLEALRPDLMARVVPADDYRRFERIWLKVPTALYEVVSRSRHPLAR